MSCHSTLLFYNDGSLVVKAVVWCVDSHKCMQASECVREGGQNEENVYSRPERGRDR